MNHNIEIINDKLYAVKFTLIPFIKEINYTPEPNTKAFTEPLRISDKGIIILNKDHKVYKILKALILKVMKYKDKKLERKLKPMSGMKSNNVMRLCYAIALQAELERRQKEKGERGCKLWEQ